MTKIKYNSDNKKDTISQIRNCVYELNDINNHLLQMNIPYDFENKNILNDIKISINKNRKDIDNYINNLNKYLDKINNNELQILSEISKIDNTIIKEINL